MSKPQRFGAEDAQPKPLELGALGSLMSSLRGVFVETHVERPAARGFAPVAPPGPRHFAPADPNANPTEGWDPFDPTVPPEVIEKVDPVATARAQGFADGLAAARGEAEAVRIAESAAIERLAQAIQDMNAFDRDALAARLRQTVLLLVTRIVGETGISPDLLAGRVAAAAQLLADSTEPARVRLNPEDIKLLEGRLPDRVTAVADPSVEPGALRVETRTTIVEDGPSAWLAQLAAAIDKTALPEAA